MANCENYQYFKKAFEVFKVMYEEDKTQIISENKPFAPFTQNISVCLKKAHIFEMDDDIKQLLIKTKTPKHNSELHFPFPVMFLDVKFTKDELANYGIKIDSDEIIGILFRKGNLTTTNKWEMAKLTQQVFDYSEVIDNAGDVNNDLFKVGEGLRISMLSMRVRDGKDEVFFETFNKEINLLDEFKSIKCETLKAETVDTKAQKFIHKFILNTINFINCRDVEIIERIRTEKNRQRRLKSGKQSLPASFVVTLDGKLKVYIDKIKSGAQRWHYGYKFEVMGHFRHLRNSKFKKKITWVNSYEKGEGVLFKKTYKVEGGAI